MKITIEHYKDTPEYRKVEIEIIDESNTSKALDACIDALVAIGHSRESIEEDIVELAEELNK